MQTITQSSDSAALSAAEVAAALRDLPGWRGDTRCLSRTVSPDDLWALLERVAAADAELDNHTVVDLDTGTITFSVCTHERGGVTAVDVELAHRISEVVEQV